MQFDVVSVLPALLAAMAEDGVIGQALRRRQISLRCWNPREYAQDVHRTVDDRPYGGGPGMVLQVGPVSAALAAARAAAPSGAPVIHLSPQGVRLTQSRVRALAELPGLVLLAGRYEGIDERLSREIDEEISIGDYVLTGGELPAMVLMDAVARLRSGVVGDPESLLVESFSGMLLDHPHYTRPAADTVYGSVPAVLLSGDHAAIARWRRKQALGRTWQRRPELLRAQCLDAESQALLREYMAEQRVDRPRGAEEEET
ncbi:MAG TPA: tRNA (guanosine(37)-N1)-methyltransferase TrmD [Gammaproteobacteria bacterium]|nr:tRNA (guanosine(37)-N1)-methyltransferase TrmD [Gammaproteobacteria bacterium]